MSGIVNPGTLINDYKVQASVPGIPNFAALMGGLSFLDSNTQPINFLALRDSSGTTDYILIED